MRYLALGYKAIALTDHCDYSNIKTNVAAILEFARHWPKDSQLTVLPGVELTHLPLAQFKPLAKYARSQGIKVIVAHGETTVEPVIKGTNRAALEADIDILAHPGLITAQDTQLAKQKGIFLEITARHGHRETDRHVIKQALKFGAKLIINTDSHSPEDIMPHAQVLKLICKFGLTKKQIAKIDFDTAKFIKEVE